MPMSSSATFKEVKIGLYPPNVRASIHCALVAKQDPVEKHKRRMMRYCILAVALAAVFLLLAIAVYYIRGNSVTIVHVSSPVPDFAGLAA